ncbi:MAG: PKD domain-containing protein [Candidatus Saccharibacteria bacterium]|nr:PKD domain-containing protein [Candidatus Saccharibacteria bacterium]
MLEWLKLSHHRHSGRLRPHEHTSYIPLGFLLLLIGLALTTFTVYAATPYNGPESASVGLTGIMPGKPPTVSATIKTPVNGQHFSTVPISISGTCPATTLVEVFKNEIFAGSTPCSDTGLYSLESDLMYGQNTLVARVYDSLNQAGPDSNSVVVYYDASAAQAGPITSLGLSDSQLVINTDAVYRGTFPGQQLNIPISILGGTPPYAVNVMWGDSTNKMVPRNDNVSFTTDHIYSRAGTYQASIQASDSKGRVAFLSFASIVNGQGNLDSTGKISSTTTNNLLVLWPLYVGSVAVVASFFIGEKREKRVLKLRGLIQNPQVNV